MTDEPHEAANPPAQTPEDAARDAAVRAIVANPSFREADQDLDFLNRYSTRGVRLQLDYLKAEQLLQGHGVAHTIVVFGSTRIRPPDAAAPAVAACQEALAHQPADEGLRQRLRIAERLAAKSRFYDVARAFGRLVGEAGEQTIGGRTMVMTGGGPGIMEAANRGAHDIGRNSIGLNISLPHEQLPNPYITPELCFRFHYFSMRKLHFLLRARALVVFPGGYGTMDELFEVLMLVQTHKMNPLPVILVGEAYWRAAFDVNFLVDEGVIDPGDRALFCYAETAEEIWAGILRWYETTGRPLLPARV